MINCTPDSFYDASRVVDLDKALARASKMAEEGADILDVGGESSRPGAASVSEQEELDRVMPLIERLVAEFDLPVSIDTSKPAVMRAACRAGARMINDINALQAEGALETAAEFNAAVCLMHMQGEPRTMQQAPHYEDVVEEVSDFLRNRVQDCLSAGIAGESIVLDPGFGFGKTLQHNLRLLGEIETLCQAGFPILVGLSRKSMFDQICASSPNQRLPASLAAAAIAVLGGATLVRAHDVAETLQAVKVAATVHNAQLER